MFINKSQKTKELTTCKSGGSSGIEDAIKPGIAPAPIETTPAEVTNAKIASRVAINRTPEKNIFIFPFYWNNFGVC